MFTVQFCTGKEQHKQLSKGEENYLTLAFHRCVIFFLLSEGGVHKPQLLDFGGF